MTVTVKWTSPNTKVIAHTKIATIVAWCQTAGKIREAGISPRCFCDATVSAYGTEVAEIIAVHICGTALATTTFSVIAGIVTTCANCICASAVGIDHFTVKIAAAGTSIVMASVTGTSTVATASSTPNLPVCFLYTRRHSKIAAAAACASAYSTIKPFCAKTTSCVEG
jgi:hypothetical protein